ncbi:MAG: 16S rRNA (cytosine(1402)-N(4))-methyltransferase RsmH [Nitrospinota bacterium]|nr:16S rRNA (cytosine(1402)-N(4))-methyltransferase RsmH [Nitrospinota bacterium]
MVDYHIPVLREEVLHYLNAGDKHLIVDGTLGDGGHAEAILQNSGPQCRVLGIDQDAEALARARKRLAPFGERIILVHGNYSEIQSILAQRNIQGIDGLLLDLGVSSRQLDTPERGFSFMHDGPLDMRMNREDTTTAADLLETLSDKELEEIIKTYGEERHYKKIVRFIRKAQGKGPLSTTASLSKILSSAVRSPRPTRINPSTRTFQALRIAVNRELDHLRTTLTDSLQILNATARLVVISFHSLEDRMVKHFFQEEAKACVCPPKTPICVCGKKSRLNILTRRVVKPSAAEVEANPRASSSKLRAAERIYV